MASSELQSVINSVLQLSRLSQVSFVPKPLDLSSIVREIADSLVSENPERSREVLKYFKYSLRYGGLKAVQYDYIPLPDSVRNVVRASWRNIVDEKGVPVFKD